MTGLFLLNADLRVKISLFAAWSSVVWFFALSPALLLAQGPGFPPSANPLPGNGAPEGLPNQIGPDGLSGVPESQPTEANHGRIPVVSVGGRLVARCEISTIHRRLPVNLFIDIESPCGLQLHNNAAQGIKAEDEAGQTTPISLHFPEFIVTVPTREAGPEDEFNEFTRLYSREIGEDAVVGALGAKFFRDYSLTLDLGSGYLHIEPGAEITEPSEEGIDPPSEEPVLSPDADDEKTIQLAVTTVDDVTWLPVQLRNGAISAMALATSMEDSLIDAEWCDEQGFPAGNVPGLQIGPLELGEFVALRPSEITYVHPDKALGVVGINLLKHLRIELNRERTQASISVTSPAEFPQSDLVFFKAMIDEDPAALESFLTEYPKERLSQEAARMLLSLYMDEDAEEESFSKAIAWLHDTWREDIRSTLALDLMKELRAGGYVDAALKAGELGVEGGRKDRYPDSVHHLHAAMGDLLLDKNENKEAWRHLLSAAFGLPEDGLINLKLGEFYERQKRYKRALSRYVQAVVHVESGEDAVAGLERVYQAMGATTGLSVDRVKQMIAGKVYNYSAATTYRPQGAVTNRVALVEFFTNTHIKHPTRDEGAIGGALGNEGIMTHFPRESVAMLTYHLPHPRFDLDSLTNATAQYHADYYGAPPAIQLVNGKGQFAGVGKAREAEAIYKAGREVVIDGLSQGTPYFMTLESRLENGVIKGELVVKGPENLSGTVHVILAEKAVLYPGRGKVIIHHMVARGALTPSIKGEPYILLGGEMRLTFSALVEDIWKGNETYLTQLQAEGKGAVQKFAARMDPNQLTVVAFIRDDRTRETLQAVQADPIAPREETGLGG